MKVSQKKPVDGKVRLECVATAEEVNNALHSAQLAFANSMGLQPQPGKTIAQAAEEHMGIKNLDSIVEQSAVDALVPLALDKKNLIPSFPPKAQPRSPFQRDRQFAFDLEVTLKPDYELSSYDPVEITIPPYSFDESLVDQQIDQMAENYTMYVTADPKPVEKGDSCLIAMRCTENGEELKGLTVDARTYVVGQGYMPEGFDAGIIGMEPGDTRTFTFEGPGLDKDFNEYTQVVEATVTVKEIQKSAKPTIDDEWLAKNMPFYKSLDDLRDNIRRTLEQQNKDQYEAYKRQAAAAELARRFTGSIPDEVYESARGNLMTQLRQQLQQQNKTWDEFVEENGGEQQLGMMLMLQTREVLVQGYALDAVFRHEKMVLTDDDIMATCHAMNPGVNPKQTRKQYEQSGRGFALRESAERMKANLWVVEHAIIHIAGEGDAAAPAAETPEATE